MSTELNEPNRRILLIDDTPSIHEDFKKILNKTDAAPKELDDAMAAFLGDDAETTKTPDAPRSLKFDIDSAYQGMEALEKVKVSIGEARPFAMAFVDVRMPPGWDGVKTIEELWKADPELQVAICTAYSDYSWDQTIARLGQSDRLLILKKPFDAVEICQFASALTEKWNLTRRERAIIEQLKTAEQEARAYASSLETVNKTLITAKAASDKVTELKTGFLLQLSEEVNKSLRSILGETTRMRASSHASTDEQSYLNSIVSLSERLMSTFNKTLDITMIEAGRMTCESVPTPVAPLIQEVFESLRARASAKSLNYQLEIAPDVPESILTDPPRLRQIIYELIENAIHYTSSGSVRARVSLEQTDNWQRPMLRCDITDTGCGIPAPARGTIFEAFSGRNANDPQGARHPGLGLALSKKLTQLMGGDITVETAPGKGSTFSLTVEARASVSV